ncbi:MAG: hypothetical protein Fur0044_01860 [Anaerolineae bacterium]|nr:hypothetical protein [Anaerolineales bacterium]MCQ3978625.1 hypothetical protein [Anaerolineae bacterium]
MYHQKYHKFNTLYNHKYGFHITGPRQDAFDAVFRLRPKVVKTLDFSVEVMKRIRQEIPDVFLIGRLFVHPQDFGQLSGGTAEAARKKGVEMAERILREEVNRDVHHINGQPIFHAWESLNEVFPEWTDENTQKLYDEYQVAFGQKMLAAGFEPVAFNFGQGNGNGPQWLKLYPGTLETYKYLGFHEYDWPTMDRLHQIGLNGPVELHNRVPGGEGRGNDGMWRCLRYRRVMNNGIRQQYGDKHTIIITECGMTQGVWGGPSLDIGPWAKECTVPRDIPGGIVATPIPVDDYWQSLLWYNSELMKDDFVMGACLFVTGASGKPEWDTFEHLGPIMDRLAAFQQVLGSDFLTGTSPVPEPLAVAGAAPAVALSEAAPVVEAAAFTRATATEVVEPAAAPSKPASRWTYTLTPGQGLPLLVGDIGVKNERVTVVKPDGVVDQLTSGSKPEHGQGGFETYANVPGAYKIQFMGQNFEIPLSGQQFTKIVFNQMADPDSVQVTINFRDGRNTYAVGEKVFVSMQVTNITAEPVPFGILGLLTSTGQFQTSWDNGVIQPGQTFRHEDGLAFNAPGVYKLQLSICFSRKDACLSSDEGWKRFEPGLEVVVQP